jgi:predicted ester cyclase
VTTTASATGRRSQANPAPHQTERSDAIPTPEHVNVVERWFDDLFTRGELDAVDYLVAPDFVAHGQGGTNDVHGRETFRKWPRWYTSAFVDREWTVHYILSEDDKAVARCSGRSVYSGGLLDIPSRDQRVFETSILILCVEGGFVQELWSEMSDLQVIMHLGAFPVPE